MLNPGKQKTITFIISKLVHYYLNTIFFKLEELCSMQKNDGEKCRHRPQFSWRLNYTNRIYVCKNCGKQIRMKSTLQNIFAMIMFAITIVALFLTGVYRLLHTNPTFFIFFLFLLSCIVWWLPGSVIYFYLLPFCEINDDPSTTLENESKE
jgi:hypothetical protein